jgi:Dolichyl-phosphate-mannose-protein mannosyltransferase
MRKPLLGFILFLVVVTYLGCYLASLDNQLGERSLAFLTTPLLELSKIGDYFTREGYERIPKTIAAVCGLLVLLGIRRRPFASNLYFGALIAGLVAEYFLVVVRMPFFGALAYGLSFLFLVLATLRKRSVDSLLEDVQDRRPFSGMDATLLALVCLVGLVFRMYALNYNFDSFEGELSNYAASATSIPGMVLANRGFGAWAPLGLLYYLPIYLTTKLFGVTLVALRLSSAIVGIFTIPLLYLFGRKIAGKEAALLAALLLALNHQHIGWGRTDIHPHGVTTWPTLVLCVVFLRACATRHVTDFILLVLAMGLTWHQYPSGQSAVAIPFIASGIYFLFNRGKLPFRWSQSTWLILGAALWFIGLPLSYYYADGKFVLDNPFNLTGPRALWGGLDGEQGSLHRAVIVTRIAIEHLGNVIEGIFYHARYLFHQDFIAEVYEMYPRTLPWLMTPFMFAGLVYLVRSAYRLEVAVLLSWVIAAIVPGILSEQAYPKRLSTLFPALDLITAIGIVFAPVPPSPLGSLDMPPLSRGSGLAAFGTTTESPRRSARRTRSLPLSSRTP